ncbi:MAG: LytTR family DNA-binding domain-containing protein [Oscillospiraceae bacterium]|nr:LytTR family DNA-binding domain-containing protein [Oscillospiraceae bacterium]
MLHIFICDDDSKQRERIEAIVRKHILIENLDMDLAFAAGSPDALLDYLDRHPKNRAQNDFGLYFLDVDLSHELNGIQLAAKIREREPIAHIVFITNHAELSYLTFRYKVEAMDYITKDFPEEVVRRVKDCIDTAYARHLSVSISPPAGSSSSFPLPIGDTVRMISVDEIMFFEAHHAVEHRLILHTKNGRFEFRSSLKKIAETLPDFYSCHRSHLLNVKNIRHIDIPQRVAVMSNGEKVLIATRKMKGLLAQVKFSQNT